MLGLAGTPTAKGAAPLATDSVACEKGFGAAGEAMLLEGWEPLPFPCRAALAKAGTDLAAAKGFGNVAPPPLGATSPPPLDVTLAKTGEALVVVVEGPGWEKLLPLPDAAVAAAAATVAAAKAVGSGGWAMLVPLAGAGAAAETGAAALEMVKGGGCADSGAPLSCRGAPMLKDAVAFLVAKGFMVGWGTLLPLAIGTDPWAGSGKLLSETGDAEAEAGPALDRSDSVGRDVGYGG